MRYLIVILGLSVGISVLAMEDNGSFPDSEPEDCVAVLATLNKTLVTRKRSRMDCPPPSLQRKFPCRYRCGWSFYTTAHRNRHENSKHELTNPIYCVFGCGAKFDRKDTMQIHCRSEHWFCCGFQFMSEQEVVQHKNENHTYKNGRRIKRLPQI